MSDLKIAIIGNVDSGKSTLVGVLTKGVLDDGRGAARRLVFNFNHEQENGRTSSIAVELMGFDMKSGQSVTAHYANPSPQATPLSSGSVLGSRRQEWPVIAKRADKILSFIDLCGHEKYLKTTIFGLMGLYPDYAAIVVNANAGLQRMSKEHLGVALGLGIPVFVVVTKIDLTPQPVFEQTLDDLSRVMKSAAVKRLPLILKASELKTIESAATALATNRVVPILCVSSVTGEGLENLRSFLRALPSRTPCDEIDAPPLFVIESAFTVAGVGTVVSGFLKKGRIVPGTPMLVGPDRNGQFRAVAIRSIHHRRVPSECVTAGATAALALKTVGVKAAPFKKQNLRKGMVLLHTSQGGSSFWSFEAEVVVMHHATTIKVGYQAMLHCGVVRQTAKVVSISPISNTEGNIIKNDQRPQIFASTSLIEPVISSCQVRSTDEAILRTGDRALVKFEFCYSPEFIQLGETILFREGRTKGFGRIVSLGPQVEG